jgi:hypothetical protein
VVLRKGSTVVASRSRGELAVVVGAASVVVIGLVVLSVLDQNRIDDDAYMFVRYARNVVASGRIAWNPGEAPTYGLTSLAYLALVLPLQVILHADPVVVLVVATLLSGIVFVALLLGVVWRHVDAASDSLRTAAAAGVALCLAWAGRDLAVHFVSGMDTMLVLAYLCAYIGAAKAWQAQPSRRRSLGLGIIGGVALWVRPELLLYAFAVPLTTWVLAPSAATGRAARGALALTLGVAALLAGIAWLYFGSPVPLATWGKVLHGYGADMDAVYHAMPAEQLAIFARDYAPFLLVAALGLGARVRSRGARGAAVEVGLALAATALILFHRFFVLAIMGSNQRFYYPALPALAFLAAQGSLALASSPAATRAWARVAPTPARAALLRQLALVLVLASLAPRAVIAVTELERAPRFAHFALRDNYAHNWPSRFWIGLDRFSALPDDLVIATTEVGHPGVFNPRKVIVDLTGLNDSEFAQHGFSSRVLFARYQPDLFMLPMHHYQELRDQLTGDPAFVRGYQLIQPPLGGLGIALRRGSKYYDAMRSALGF